MYLFLENFFQSNKSCPLKVNFHNELKTINIKSYLKTEGNRLKSAKFMGNFYLQKLTISLNPRFVRLSVGVSSFLPPLTLVQDHPLNSSPRSPRVRSRKYKRQRRLMEMDGTRGRKRGTDDRKIVENRMAEGLETRGRAGRGAAKGAAIRCFQGLKAFRSAGALFSLYLCRGDTGGRWKYANGSRRNR